MSVGRNDPCPCGSGRKFKHCHAGSTSTATHPASRTAPLFQDAQRHFQEGEYAQAAALYYRILDINPEHADARHYLGLVLSLQGDREAGLAHLRASLTLRPADAIYHHNLGVWLEEYGDLDGSVRHFQQALGHAPNYLEARASLAKLLLRRGYNVEARLHLELLLQADPTNIEHRSMLADVHHRLGEYGLMQREFDTLLRLHPQQSALRLRYAELLQLIGREDEAISQCDAVLVHNPDNLDAMKVRVFIDERRNRLDEAERHAQVLVQRTPHDSTARRHMARLRRRRGDLKGALEWLTGIDTAAMSLLERSHHYMELGTILDKQGRYVDAFAAFREGNEAGQRHIEECTGEKFYDPERTRRQVTALEQFFTRERVQALRVLSPPPGDGPEPIFIVGFPRSGTTLVEQMLAAHPSVHAGDELNALHLLEATAAGRLASREPFPGCLDNIHHPAHQGALREFREAYLVMAREAGAIGPGTKRFTDKMPLNEMRLGLLHLIFPEAPVVHVVRHPFDVLLSCYFNELFHGNNCALSLETAAFHYRAVFELVEAQRAQFDLRFARIRYEDVIREPETELRRLLEFIGEPWDARCLEFHQSARVARTASYAQVAQQLYASSVGRWRHYREFLEPVVPILRPMLERLGYGLE